MPPSFPEILNSRIFKFIVGETADGISTDFFVHEEAIAQLSTPLCSLVKGNLSEAQTGCALWKDVSKETFEPFVQFAYTGDYSIPKAEKRNEAAKPEIAKINSITHPSSSSAPNGIKTRNKTERQDETLPSVEATAYDFPAAEGTGEEPTIDPGDIWAVWGSSQKKKAKSKSGSLFYREEVEAPAQPPSSRPVAANFRSLSFPLMTPRNYHSATCDPAEPFKADQSYLNVFVTHVSMYILGDYHLIDSLKALALHKLHKTLCIFQLNDTNAPDVIALARLAYSEEGNGCEGGIGGLRDLVCQYLSANAVVLSRDAGFMDLLGEGGQFVKDFFKYELQRTH